jgi:small subunit ribosomal protein S1
MVNKSVHGYQEDVEDGIPPLDESWWEAVLTEDEPQREPPTSSTEISVSGDDSSKESDDQSVLQSVDWDAARKLYQQDEVFTLNVSGHNRGGLLVSGDGLQGFVPISHLLEISNDSSVEEHQEILASYVSRQIKLKVIECDQDRGRVVFSERAAQATPGSRNELLNNLHPGDTITGRVTNITNFGVFVDLGGIEGLIHVSELSWGRVRHPADAIQYNQELRVFVISVDQARSRVALSVKRLTKNPWASAAERYSPGQIIEATITSVVPFGVFARLEDGLDGLIHISEIVLDDGTEINDCYYEGQIVQVRVLHIDATNQRMGLSTKLYQ